MEVDPFTVSWAHKFVYAFPPFCMIGKVLQKMKVEGVTDIIIFPLWPTQHWYSLLGSMLIDFPVSLFHRDRSVSVIHHPLLNAQDQACSSTCFWQTPGTAELSETAQRIIEASWRDGTKKQHNCYFKQWFSFCSRRDWNTFHASVKSAAEFLTELSERGLRYSALNTARSTLSAFLTIGDSPLGEHPLICRFMKGDLFHTVWWLLGEPTLPVWSWLVPKEKAGSETQQQDQCYVSSMCTRAAEMKVCLLEYHPTEYS
ncbi:uncharacterized protein LOC106159107 isoform X2 [Lingula anatina]|uniref:Uncharacterized protein LOC106159107 isoform X2 n=1 Tax=Lingula anatina TaxID=7574 RepID=A0A2R2MR58_LINAN|nr:uncharacterized protein LOC106159107 isoform X2 [Lingula anatina]|eukprot:XP_023932633.1 uncharacterized protein LOC106159107 isoform X2 [Lingula anatina]